MRNRYHVFSPTLVIAKHSFMVVNPELLATQLYILTDHHSFRVVGSQLFIDHLQEVGILTVPYIFLSLLEVPV
jgi:hypothetical protein